MREDSQTLLSSPTAGIRRHGHSVTQLIRLTFAGENLSSNVFNLFNASGLINEIKVFLNSGPLYLSAVTSLSLSRTLSFTFTLTLILIFPPLSLSRSLSLSFSPPSSLSLSSLRQTTPYCLSVSQFLYLSLRHTFFLSLSLSSSLCVSVSMSLCLSPSMFLSLFAQQLIYLKSIKLQGVCVLWTPEMVEAIQRSVITLNVV